MKLSSIYKEIWNDFDEKELFSVVTNGGTYSIYYYSLDELGNASPQDVIKHGSEPDLINSIEKLY